MKTTLLGKKKYLPYIFSTLVVLNVSNVFAQSDPLLEETENILNSQQIDIDGTFKKKTAADRIEEMRRKLEKRNEDMVDKKIEDMRMKEERKLAKKLQKAFAGQLQAIDEQPVQVKQAAPVVIAPEPIKEEKKLDKQLIKVIPTFGISNIASDNVDYDTSMNLGIGVEAMLSKRFSVGMKFNYSKMNITDDAYNNRINPYDYSYNSSNYYGDNYQKREMNYSQFAIGATGKVYLVTEGRFRPYFGLGTYFNRVSLKYNNQEMTPYTAGNYNVYYGDEGYSSSYISGQVMLGSEVSFNEMFGLMVEFSYTRNLSSGFNSKSVAQSGSLNPDQLQLEKHGQDIEEANFFSLGAGFVVSF